MSAAATSHGTPPEDRLAVISDPFGDLPFAAFEGALAARIYGPQHAQCLGGADATRTATLAALAAASTWLFATHAGFDPLDPRQSGIRLSGGRDLSLGELLEQPGLGRPRLVVLSACDSAIHDVNHAPDEFFGLLGGFLQLGAATATGNLWPVDDVSASVLTARALWIHRATGRSFSAALVDAQRWLQGSGASTIAEWIDEIIGSDPTVQPPTDLMAWLRGQEDQPVFADPIWWAAAVSYGH